LFVESCAVAREGISEALTGGTLPDPSLVKLISGHAPQAPAPSEAATAWAWAEDQGRRARRPTEKVAKIGELIKSREAKMTASIDNYIAEIFEAASSIREEGVTDGNKRVVSQAISSIAYALSALQRRIDDVEAERARVISPE
jgi:hypothetical protein